MLSRAVTRVNSSKRARVVVSRRFTSSEAAKAEDPSPTAPREEPPSESQLPANASTVASHNKAADVLPSKLRPKPTTCFLECYKYPRISTFRDAERFFQHCNPKPVSVFRAFHSDLTTSCAWKAEFESRDDAMKALNSIKGYRFGCHKGKFSVSNVLGSRHMIGKYDADSWLLITGVPAWVSPNRLRRVLTTEDNALRIVIADRVYDLVRGQPVEAMIAKARNEEEMSLFVTLMHKATVSFGRGESREIRVMPLT